MVGEARLDHMQMEHLCSTLLYICYFALLLRQKQMETEILIKYGITESVNTWNVESLTI